MFNYRSFRLTMKKCLALIVSFSSVGMFAVSQEPDCGIGKFFNDLADRIYCAAETTGPDGIEPLLKSGTTQFADLLANCTPRQESSKDIMYQIAAHGTPEMLKAWSQSAAFGGYDTEYPDRGTPLMAAAFTGNIPMVRSLLEHGANPSKEMRHGEKVMTPLMAATRVPEIYYRGGFGVMGVLSTIVVSNARNAGYPYDQAMVKEFDPITSGFLPFFVCHKLIEDKIASLKAEENRKQEMNNYTNESAGA